MPRRPNCRSSRSNSSSWSTVSKAAVRSLNTFVTAVSAVGRQTASHASIRYCQRRPEYEPGRLSPVILRWIEGSIPAYNSSTHWQPTRFSSRTVGLYGLLEVLRETASGEGFVKQQADEVRQESAHLFHKPRGCWVRLTCLVWQWADQLLDFVACYDTPVCDGRRGPVWHVVRRRCSWWCSDGLDFVLEKVSEVISRVSIVYDAHGWWLRLLGLGVSPRTFLNVCHNRLELPLFAAISLRQKSLFFCSYRVRSSLNFLALLYEKFVWLRGRKGSHMVG